MQDAWRTYLELATGLGETSRKRVRKVVKEAVGKGNATADQVKNMTSDLMAANSANREALSKLVKFEVDRALGRVGLATAEEVRELTTRVRDLERQLREARANGAGASTAASSTARKSVARKTAAKSTPARATKSTATKSTATKATKAASARTAAKASARTATKAPARTAAKAPARTAAKAPARTAAKAPARTARKAAAKRTPAKAQS